MNSQIQFLPSKLLGCRTDFLITVAIDTVVILHQRPICSQLVASYLVFGVVIGISFYKEIGRVCGRIKGLI